MKDAGRNGHVSGQNEWYSLARVSEGVDKRARAWPARGMFAKQRPINCKSPQCQRLLATSTGGLSSAMMSVLKAVQDANTAFSEIPIMSVCSIHT